MSLNYCGNKLTTWPVRSVSEKHNHITSISLHLVSKVIQALMLQNLMKRQNDCFTLKKKTLLISLLIYYQCYNLFDESEHKLSCHSPNL